MSGLSVCIIACNEERELPRCLASAAFADEVVVVVDARSRDGTEALARAAGARVRVHPYQGNVEQKNVALDLATHDWVLALDADEAVSPALAAAIRAELARGPAVAGYELNRITWHLGRWIRHGDFYPDWQLRLFARARARWAGTNPHGRVRIHGRVGRIAGELEHRSYRDLADQLERIQEFSRVQAHALFAQGRRSGVYDWAVRPPLDFLRAYVLKQGWRDGVPGFAIAASIAFHAFLKWAKLWELEHAGAAGAGEPAGKAARAPGA